jgi:IMP dehydrogenase
VMLGSMLSGTKEAPGEVFQSADNKQYKVYRGMASPEAQIAWRGEARSLEGISTTVPYKGEVAEILRNLHKNVKSGLSYTGACSLAELRAKARFIQQTQSGLSESQTHILTK